MWLIVLEALAAGGVLVAIVWWTMFAGRKGGERADRDGTAALTRAGRRLIGAAG